MTGSHPWNGMHGGDFFFLVVCTDGAGVESSWGMNSPPAERNGMYRSGECSTILEEKSEDCPQQA
jgi:hypothetical protein